jgi:ferrous iron transport protein A
MTDILNRKEMSVVLVVCVPSPPTLVSDQTVEAVYGAQTDLLAAPPVITPSRSSQADQADYSLAKQEYLTPGSGQGFDHTLRDILGRGGYGSVEVGYCRNGQPSLEEAIDRAVTHGAQWIMVVPTVISLLQIPPCECFVEGSPNSLEQRIGELQSQYPNTKIVYAGPPFDDDRLLDLILSKIREYEPPTFKTGVTQLNDLRTGEVGVVRELDGGTHFRSRMASLGFTPGALVKMVQNYGHGAVIVSLRGTRVALGRGEARKVGISRRMGDSYPVI